MNEKTCAEERAAHVFIVFYKQIYSSIQIISIRFSVSA